MNFINPLRKSLLFSGFILFSALLLHSQSAEDHPWRTWVSSNGEEIEAYLKEVTPNGAVIVRRDGREFTVSPDRLSEADRAYIQGWKQEEEASGEDYEAIDFLTAQTPQEYEISGFEQVRLSSGEPPEAGAVKAILNFFEIPYDPNISERFSARKPIADVLISPSDIAAVLSVLPVGTKSFVLPPPGERDLGGPELQEVFNAIKKAISLDLPVLIGYRPEIQIDTPEFVAVGTRYDRRTLYAVEAEGSRKPVPLDWRTLEESLVQATIIYPLPSAGDSENSSKPEPSREFLSEISEAVRAEVGRSAVALTERLKEKEFSVSLQDVNRSDLRGQLGSTRSFARQGGIPQINALLERGSVAIVPQEFDSGNGFALIYGKSPDGFAAVEYYPGGNFKRGIFSEADLASRWMTREDRTYRLDLIEISVPKQSNETK